MVDCVHYTDKWAAVLDNNFPGDDQYEWMAPDEFLNRWKQGSGGWVIVLLSGNPPPPIPINNGERRGVSPPSAPTCNCCRACLCGSSCNCKANGKPCCRRCDCEKLARSASKGTDNYDQVEDKHHCPYPRWWHWAPICWRCHTHRPYCEDVEAWPFIRRIPRPFHPRPIRPRLWQWIFRIDIFRRHDVENYGVNKDQMPKDPAANPFYSHRGQQITALEAFELVGKGGTLTDDTQKKRLTVIGTPDQTAKVLADIQANSELAVYRDKLVVNAYTSTHWAVAGIGLSGSSLIPHPC
jgi:hypothetical protein